MSIKAMNWVWERSRSIGNDRLVLLAIADRASDEGMDAWPSIKTLANKTLLHERTVQRCIRSIEALGELEIKRNASQHGTNVYIVRMDSLSLGDSRPRRRVPAPRDANLPPGDKLPPGGATAGGGVAPSPPGGGATAGGGVAPPPPDSSCTSSTTITSTNTAAAAPRLSLAKEPNENGNYRVIERLGRELLEHGFWDVDRPAAQGGGRFWIQSEQDLIDALKDECGRLQINRGSHVDVAHDVIHRAAACAWFKHAHPDIVAKARTS